MVVVAARKKFLAWFARCGMLFVYGIVPTLQPANFGRVYAAHSGVFLFLSLFWGWKIDQNPPDKFDILGAGIALVGVFVIMYSPRS